MRSVCRAVASLTLLAAAATTTVPQTRAPLNNVDPFSISSGRSFSASVGSAPIEEKALPQAPSRIALEIREAQTIISRNYVSRERSKESELMKFGIDGMLKSLDPHSNFYDAAEWKEMLDEQRSSYSGIGATISSYGSGENLATYVLGTFPGSAAARARVRFGDKIVAVNGEKVVGRASDYVRDRLRGPNGSVVKVTLERGESRRLEAVEMRRSSIPQPSIPDAYILRPSIGYMELSEGFTYTTYDEFDAALADLKRQGMKSLILDLRGNGGGIVDQAVKVAQRFLPAGQLILTQRGRTRLDNRVWRSNNLKPEQMPLVVLVDEDTASASEIVAGAFQDDDRALIVGEKTFGKGLVQSVIDLPGRSGLTLTTGRYLTPSGRSIQRDYSKMPLFDYYQHKAVAAEIGRPFFEARTVTNRRVFGGDGIQPDEVVQTPELTELEAALIDTVFFFTRDLLAGRVDGFTGYRLATGVSGKRISAVDFPISSELMQAFDKFAQTRLDVQHDPEQLGKSRAFVKTRIRYNLALAAHGAVSANQVLIEDDPQTAKAVESLPGAARLAEAAQRREKR
jgi:carboxyl-terminal processing protease